MSDPRVFFAAERTLLAWVRSGLTVIGLGFVVARFGLFLRLFRSEPTALPVHPVPVTYSMILGVGLTLIGTFVILAAAKQHLNFLKGLPQEDLPKHYMSALAPGFAVALGLIGLLVAIYLVIGIR